MGTKKTVHTYHCRRDHDHDDHGADLPYLLFTPDTSADSSKAFPLIVFLHGWDERAEAACSEEPLERVMDTGLPHLAALECLPPARGAEFPMVVAAPQTKRFWSRHTVRGHVIDLVEEVIREQNVDRECCYLTGISMGAIATWENAALRPDLFAALLPVSGEVPPEAANTAEVPVWVFAGGRDTSYPVERVESDLKAFRGRGGGAEMTLTVEPGAAHHQEFWNRLYKRSHVYEWLLSHSRAGNAL